MWLELRAIFTHLSHDPSTRAIVLSGAGPKAFTTGLDVLAASQTSLITSDSASSPSTSKVDGARFATNMRRHIIDFQDCISAIERCEKPVIAALHGYTLGLGIDIAVCCDVRICAAETRFAVKEVDIGLAADIGTLSRLEKVVGAGSWVKDVCLSARTFGAEEAGRVGFVSWVAKGGKEAVVEEAVRWAGVVAGKSPVAVQGTKELLNWSREHTVQDGEFWVFQNGGSGSSKHLIKAVLMKFDNLYGRLNSSPGSRTPLHQCVEQRYAAIQRCDGRHAGEHAEENPSVRETITFFPSILKRGLYEDEMKRRAPKFRVIEHSSQAKMPLHSDSRYKKIHLLPGKGFWFPPNRNMPPGISHQQNNPVRKRKKSSRTLKPLSLPGANQDAEDA